MAIILLNNAIIRVIFTDMNILATMSSDVFGEGMFDSKSVGKEFLTIYAVACDEDGRNDGESITSTAVREGELFFDGMKIGFCKTKLV